MHSVAIPKYTRSSLFAKTNCDVLIDQLNILQTSARKKKKELNNKIGER